MNTLAGKVVWVTGSSRGIGSAIAKAFAQQGARVAIHGRDRAALGAVAADLERRGARTVQVAGELTKLPEIEAMRAEIEQALGPIDVLVANAGGGYTRPGPIEEISEENWRLALDVNLTATFLTVKAVLPGMKQRRSGSIITLSSAAARRAHPQSPAAYAAAKAGVEMLTKDLAAQAGPYDVRVNCIAPETILTERNQTQIPRDTQRELVDQHPLKRLGTPDDVARAALFLASDNASWITGVVLDVAGGAVMV
jgi:3-oxoacyl-[acyl-carrier protein] reductase